MQTCEACGTNLTVPGAVTVYEEIRYPSEVSADGTTIVLHPNEVTVLDRDTRCASCGATVDGPAFVE